METSHAATFGVAMMGGLAAGVYQEIEDVPMLANYKDHVTPHPEAVLMYSRYHELYTQLYPNLKSIMHKRYELYHNL